MTENYTAEDFAKANLATRDKYGVARRTDPRVTHQWYAYGGEPGWFSDEEMAADGWTPVVESGRLSLARLEAAWEAAEEADTCNAGDVLITRHAPEGSFEIGPAKSRGRINLGVTRILSRAPREPWADLADSLEAEVQWIDRFNAVDAAQALYALGWRKGGDDDE